MGDSRWRRLVAELLGTGVLVAAVVGSGIMASRLTTDVGLQLLINALATVAALGVMIATLGPISGAHFNPAVTLIAAIRREVSPGEASLYVAAQFAGGLAGVAVANLMFGLPAWQASTHHRAGSGLLLGEAVATAGLLLVIGVLTRTGRGRLGALAVPAWIGAAYFFTASTSFANPAVTLARSLTNTFTGIAPADVMPFVAAQLVGAALGAGITELLLPRPGVPEPLDLPEAVHEHQ
ncbi:MAG TPA: MIP/aquaporin family protein [Candidatus Nanopelagicales bacterium]|jgi:arsenate reductase